MAADLKIVRTARSAKFRRTHMEIRACLRVVLQFFMDSEHCSSKVRAGLPAPLRHSLLRPRNLRTARRRHRLFLLAQGIKQAAALSQW